MWSLPLPIPNNPLGYVFCYALKSVDGLVLIDVGWDAEDSYAALVSGINTIGACIGDVRGILVTHIHPDHYGLAGRIREESGAWVGVHAADAALIHDRYEDVDGLLARMEAWLRRADAPEEAIGELWEASLSIRRAYVRSRPDRLLQEGDRVEVSGGYLRAIHTPGHTPGHVCFYAAWADLIFTGDHVLPRITPNVGRSPQSTEQPLDDYLDSLKRVVKFGNDPLVLPGHEHRFRGLHERINDLIAHHAERLSEIEELVAAGADTTWEIAARTRWSRGWGRLEGHMRRMALAEVHAHLVHLEREGRLRIDDRNLADGRRSPMRWKAVN